MPTVAFVCRRNAGRSQMATALARRELVDRNLEGTITLVTGGVDPADAVHDEVVQAMDEVGIDVSDAEPREITDEDLREADYVITLGCSVDLPEGFDGVHREWDVQAPEGEGIDGTRAVRDEIEECVVDLIDDLHDRTTDDAGP